MTLSCLKQAKMVCLKHWKTFNAFMLIILAPSGPPQNVSTIITSSRSFTVQWTPPQPDLQNGVIQHYLVQIVVAQTSEVLQHSVMGQSLTLSNLHPHYIYTCTVTAVTVSPGPAALVTFQLPQDGTSTDIICIIVCMYTFHSSNWPSIEYLCHSS